MGSFSWTHSLAPVAGSGLWKQFIWCKACHLPRDTSWRRYCDMPSIPSAILLLKYNLCHTT